LGIRAAGASAPTAPAQDEDAPPVTPRSTPAHPALGSQGYPSINDLMGDPNARG